ncbi:helix-turn-helix domain-containing protein [Gorillibacterium massiliense]|uniref:response regulator transcription factor n=1 Tax=Gorillibacterium massiliense TaxID=1280390 RepID=UPI0004B90607|nr:helix-turn-helix domain-containing protein [Gorillibacterium massiliense]
MFVDLSMPVMSGIELIQAVRQKHQALRYVVLTFHEEFENVQTAYRMGVLDYISKVRLDSEDDDQILGRIRHKLMDEPVQQTPLSPPVLGAKVSFPGEKEVRPSQEEQWSKLQQEWRSQYWLYNEVYFQSLCKRTLEDNPSVRRLEGLFLRVISQIETVIPLEAEFRLQDEDVRSVIEWIREYRKTIYSQVTRSADLTKTMVCMLKAVLFIREQAAEPLHAEDVADHVNMSRSYFCQMFKKLTGATFNEYLRQERIRAAERLLCETNRSIAWVANAVGYGDSKYFSHLFYEQTRLLPSEFRAQFSKGEQ